MEFAFIDFESYWSDTVTLKKLTPAQYLAHHEFELISVSVKIGRHGKTLVAFGEEGIRALLNKVQINKYACVAHNMNGFDSLILLWKLGFNPPMMLCTLSMARPKYSKVCGLGLGPLVAHLGLGVKDGQVLLDTKGKHLRDFTREELMRMAKYNGEDTDQCAALFYHLLPDFSAQELWLMDATIRARVEPELRVNEERLEEALAKERIEKSQRLAELASTLNVQPGKFGLQEAMRATLSSTAKFVTLLEDLGYEVPYKPSPKNASKLIPALAKSDEAFIEMLESDDELLSDICAARLSVKSTLLETRIEKLLAEQRATPNYSLPIPLRIWGADTTGRWSGEIYNPQNFPRITKGKPKNSDAIRLSIEAPDGYVVGVADQSSIEMRVNHFLWKCRRTMSLYAAKAKADLYRDFASVHYKKPPEDVTDPERQVGKVSHLGLGFGSGPATFLRIARIQGGIRDMTLEQATTTTFGWRDIYKEIPQGWEKCQEALNYMAEGVERPIDPWGLCHTTKDGIVLPTVQGRKPRLIRYPFLRRERITDPRTGREKWEWVYGHGRFWRRIYGPKVDENIVQAMARDTVAHCAIEFFKDTGLRFKMMTHDELIYLFKEALAEQLLAHLQTIMRRPLPYWPELVLYSEGGFHKQYGLAKH